MPKIKKLKQKGLKKCMLILMVLQLLLMGIGVLIIVNGIYEKRLLQVIIGVFILIGIIVTTTFL